MTKTGMFRWALLAGLCFTLCQSPADSRAQVSGDYGAEQKQQMSEKSDAEQETQEVVAVGVGKTPEDARKQAFFSAVEQVVGALVDAKINVKDNEVIQEQILTLSDGYIEDFAVVEPARMVEGAYQETIRAKVKRTRLLSKLSDDNVALKSAVRGELLFAQAVSQGRVREQAVSIVAALLFNDPFEYRLEMLQPPGKADLLTLSEEQLAISENWLKVQLSLSVDNTNFSKNVLPKLRQALDAVAVRHETNVCPPNKRSYDRSRYNGQAPGLYEEYEDAYNTWIKLRISPNHKDYGKLNAYFKGREGNRQDKTFYCVKYLSLSTEQCGNNLDSGFYDDQIGNYVALNRPFISNMRGTGYSTDRDQGIKFPIFYKEHTDVANFFIMTRSEDSITLDAYELPPAFSVMLERATTGSDYLAFNGGKLGGPPLTMISIEVVGENERQLVVSAPDVSEPKRRFGCSGPVSENTQNAEVTQQSKGMVPQVVVPRLRAVHPWNRGDEKCIYIIPALHSDRYFPRYYMHNIKFDVLIPVSLETLNALREVRVSIVD